MAPNGIMFTPSYAEIGQRFARQWRETQEQALWQQGNHSLTSSTGDSGRKTAVVTKCQNPKIRGNRESFNACHAVQTASCSFCLFTLFNAFYGLVNLKDVKKRWRPWSRYESI